MSWSTWLEPPTKPLLQAMLTNHLPGHKEQSNQSQSLHSFCTCDMYLKNIFPNYIFKMTAIFFRWPLSSTKNKTVPGDSYHQSKFVICVKLVLLNSKHNIGLCCQYAEDIIGMLKILQGFFSLSI